MPIFIIGFLLALFWIGMALYRNNPSFKMFVDSLSNKDQSRKIEPIPQEVIKEEKSKTDGVYKIGIIKIHGGIQFIIVVCIFLILLPFMWWIEVPAIFLAIGLSVFEKETTGKSTILQAGHAVINIIIGVCSDLFSVLPNLIKYLKDKSKL